MFQQNDNIIIWDGQKIHNILIYYAFYLIDPSNTI